MMRGLSMAIVGLLLTAAPAQAWSGRGHMIVAAVAWEQLDQDTRAEVTRLLRLNPDYPTWTAGIVPADRDKIAFMRAAAWADDIKQDGDYVEDGFAKPEHVGDGYSDFRRHRIWHYINVPFTQDGSKLPQIPHVNALGQINSLSVAIGPGSGTDTVRSYSLAWLLHLVGDVHQPLHASTRVMAFTPKGDGGGNDTKVSCTGCGDTLHSFWDDALGWKKDVPAVLALVEAGKAQFFAPFDPTSVAAAPEVWIDESFALARDKVYKAPIRRTAQTSAITPNYRNRAVALAHSQMALAAARLAHLLNKSL